MAPRVTVLSGGAAPAAPPRSQLATAYEHFRLERQGNLVSAATLENYDALVTPFLSWAGEAGVRRFADLDLGTARAYRRACRPGSGSTGGSYSTKTQGDPSIGRADDAGPLCPEQLERRRGPGSGPAWPVMGR
jgi:hypothetical protein